VPVNIGRYSRCPKSVAPLLEIDWHVYSLPLLLTTAAIPLLLSPGVGPAGPPLRPLRLPGRHVRRVQARDDWRRYGAPLCGFDTVCVTYSLRGGLAVPHIHCALWHIRCVADLRMIDTANVQPERAYGPPLCTACSRPSAISPARLSSLLLLQLAAVCPHARHYHRRVAAGRQPRSLVRLPWLSCA
jgi:hypothetical protein